jgi:hypothetical protein
MSFEEQPKPEIDPVESKLGREIEEAEEAMWEAIAVLDRANKELLERFAAKQDLVASGVDTAEATQLLREFEFLVSDLTDAAREIRGRYEELCLKRREYLDRKRGEE